MGFFQTLVRILTQPISVGTLDLPFSILELITRVGLPLLGMIIGYMALMWAVRKIFALTRITKEHRDTALHYVRLGLKFIVIIGLTASVGNLLGSRVNYYFSRFLFVLNEPFFVSGKTRISVVTLLMLIPVFYLASWSGKTSRKVLESSVFDQFGLDDARKFSFGSLIRYVVMTIVFLLGMSIVGLDLSALSVILGVLGIGLGFGLQGIVANFFAGLIIISTRPIKEGDRVLVNGCDGIVHNIRLISTDIRTFENENIIIPNSHFVENAVHNYSYTDRKIVIVNKVQVSYGTDLEEAVVLLEEVGKKNPYRISGPDNVVRVLSFDDSGISMSLRTLVRDVSLKAAAHSWTNLEIWKAFRDKGIEIPFPQMDVHVKSMPAGEAGEEGGEPV